MKQGFHVCLYKRKGQPIITAFVKGEEAEIAMSLEDFKIELLKEIGPVTWIMLDKTFKQKVEEAFNAVVRNIKEGAVKIA